MNMHDIASIPVVTVVLVQPEMLVGERRGLRTAAQQQTGRVAGSRISSDS
jgi:hypothetical protein